MSTPSLTKEALFGLLHLAPPSPEEIEKARARRQAKADKAAKAQEKKQGKAAQKTAIRTSTDKPIYEDTARPAVDVAIKELEALPGANDALVELMTLRRDAAFLAEAGKYSEAVALLKPVKDIRAKGVKTATQSDKSARKAFAPVFSSADALRKLVKDTKVLSERGRAGFASEIDVAVAVLHLPDGGDSEADAVAQSLALLKDELDRTVLAANAAKTDGERSLIEADSLLVELKACATEGEVARIKTLIDGARTLQAEREYSEAKDAVDEAVRAGAVIRDAAALAKSQWEIHAGKLNAQLAAARVLAAKRDAPTLSEITPTAREVVDGWEELKDDAKTLPGFGGYAQAVQTYELLTAQLADLDARAKTDAALGPLRKSANDRVLQALEEVDDKLGNLHKRVVEFFPDRDEKDLDGPFLDEKAAAEAAWRQGMRRVGSDKELLALSESIMKKLGAACARIDKVIDDVGSFTDALADRDVEIARQGFERARENCAKVIGTLLSANAPIGILQADLLEALVKQEAVAKSVGAIEGLTKKAATLAVKTQMQVQKYSADSAKVKARVTEQLKSADDKLKTLVALIAEKSKLDWVREPTRERDYGELRDLLKEQLDQQRPLARMSEAGILDECEGDLIALNFSLAAAIAAIKGGKEAKALNVSSISSMSAEITKLRERLNKHDVVKYSAELQFELSGSLDTLEGELKSLPLEQARMRINEFEKDLASAEVATASARAAYKKFEANAATVRKGLKDGAFQDAGDYKNVLKGKLDKCLADALAGGVTSVVTEALEDIKTEIQTATTDPRARKAGQDGAAADARKAEQDAAEWKSRYQIVVAAIAKNTTILTKERAELTQLAEGANKVYRNTKDLQAATMQLRIVNDRIEFLQKYPEGMDVTARNKLPKARDRWKQAVGDLKAGLDELVEEVKKRGPADVPAPAAKAVADTIASVKNLFDPVLFDPAVEAMSGKKQPKNELSAIREEALRAVHRAQAVFETDQRVVDLSRNPFKPGLNRQIANASLALAEFETNLLISL